MPRKTSKNIPVPLQVQPPSKQTIDLLFEKALEEYVKTSSTMPDPYKIIGTLPDWAIQQYIQDGVIKIDPLESDWADKIDEVTLDFHLGNTLKVFTQEGLNTIDTRYTTKEEMEAMMRIVHLKPGQPFILTENDFIIATTKERLTIPDDMIAHLHGKSSLARLGIVVHSTAARFDPGWDGYPVLEFGTFLRGKKIVIYEGSTICAFSFEKLAHPTSKSYKNNPNAWIASTNPEASQIASYNTSMNGAKKR